jgi:hypothetical protein
LWPQTGKVQPNAVAMATRGTGLDTGLEARVRTIRTHRVMLDRDLAELYGVSTGSLNQAVSRNLDRFPAEFMFRLTREEFRVLKSQSVISNRARGGSRWTPMAFTEHGVAMLSTVLRSPRAVAVSVEIIRTFIRLRRLQREHGDLVERLDELEAKYDANFKDVFEAIRALMQPPSTRRRPIGFRPPSKRPKPGHQTARLLGRAAGRRGMDGDGRSS